MGRATGWGVAVFGGMLALGAAAARANDGQLDATFGNGGRQRVAFDVNAAKTDHVRKLALQPDGRIVLYGSVGPNSVGLARLLPNGAKDTSFDDDGNHDGKVVFGFPDPMEPRGLAVLSDGRIVVAAQSGSYALLNRRDASGGLTDPFPGAGFGYIAYAIPGGGVTQFVDLAPLPGGKFLAAGIYTAATGNADYFVARFSADGVPDASFGTASGYTRIAFDLDIAREDRAVGLALATDGRIAVVGTVSEGDHDIGIAMLQANGQPDTTFAGTGRMVVNFDIGGIVSDDRAAGACFGADGNLLVGATISGSIPTTQVGLALVSPAGAPVGGFGSNGRRAFAIIDDTSAAGVACPRDGTFLLAGTYQTPDADQAPTEAFVTRFLADGSSDFGFGPSLATLGFGLNHPGTTPAGRADAAVAITLTPGGVPLVAFDTEYQSPDYDYAVARLTQDRIFTDGFQ